MRILVSTLEYTHETLIGRVVVACDDDRQADHVFLQDEIVDQAMDLVWKAAKQDAWQVEIDEWKPERLVGACVAFNPKGWRPLPAEPSADCVCHRKYGEGKCYC